MENNNRVVNSYEFDTDLVWVFGSHLENDIVQWLFLVDVHCVLRPREARSIGVTLHCHPHYCYSLLHRIARVVGDNPDLDDTEDTRVKICLHDREDTRVKICHV